MTGSPDTPMTPPAQESISISSALKSGASLIASARKSDQERFLTEIPEPVLAGLPYLFEFWAMEHQVPPEGDWHAWVILGGRGAGKTRAGAEWVRAMVEGPRPGDPGRAKRIALIGETVDQAREVMVFGESGLLACSPPDRQPQWIAGRKMLLWPNGAVAQVFSAFDPEALRGPQFDAAWADELAKWPKAQETWDMLQFALRLGEAPRVCVTTTPRNSGALKALLSRQSTVVTHAPTEANAANLARSFLEEVRLRYAGTRLGRQELDGVLVADPDGALWPAAMLDAARIDKAPELDRIVVAVDPPVTARRKSDECGIVVAGVRMQGPPRDWCAYVLEDASLGTATPLDWVRAAIDAMERHGADRLVVEVNQGGDMIEQILRQEDPNVPFRAVRATKGKALRAEPVAALYEQGRVRHLPGMGRLEDQMGQMTLSGFRGEGSPDRVDALVWALHELILARATPAVPRLRML